MKRFIKVQDELMNFNLMKFEVCWYIFKMSLGKYPLGDYYFLSVGRVSISMII